MRKGFNIGLAGIILNMSSESKQGGQTVTGRGRTKEPRTFKNVLHGLKIECQKQYNLRYKFGQLVIVDWDLTIVCLQQIEISPIVFQDSWLAGSQDYMNI